MEVKQPIVIDFRKRETLRATSSHLPLLSWQTSDCDRVGFEYYEHPAHESPSHYLAQHALVIILNSTTKIWRELGESSQWEQNLPSKVALVPANVNHKVAWGEKVEFILLTLEPKFVAECAYEAIEPDRVEILPHFAQSDPLVYQIGLTLKDTLETGGASNCFYIESLFNTLSIHILKNYTSRPFLLREYSDGLPRHRLKRVLEFINENLEKDIKLTTIAGEVGMSQYYFCRLFKQSTGITPYQYLLQQRVERAKQLLKQGDILIADIALSCGFSSQSHFTQQFRKLTGVTPKVYRDSQQP